MLMVILFLVFFVLCSNFFTVWKHNFQHFFVVGFDKKIHESHETDEVHGPTKMLLFNRKSSGKEIGDDDDGD